MELATGKRVVRLFASGGEVQVEHPLGTIQRGLRRDDVDIGDLGGPGDNAIAFEPGCSPRGNENSPICLVFALGRARNRSQAGIRIYASCRHPRGCVDAECVCGEQVPGRTSGTCLWE